MMRRIKNLLRSQKGQSLVEFVLVLPIFIVLLFGIMEFGRIWETMNVLTSAAREGARVAAVTNPNVGQATSAAQNLLTSANIRDVTINVTGPNSSDQVVVTVSCNYVPLTGGIVPGIGSLSLSRSTSMRWEG
jgi:Flp pilus assembly protein TadG